MSYSPLRKHNYLQINHFNLQSQPSFPLLNMSSADLQDQKYPWNQIIITLITTLCALFLLLSCYNFLTRQWILLNRPRRRLLNEAVANPEDPSLPFQSQGLAPAILDPSLPFQSQGLAPAILHALPAFQFKKTDGEANPSNCDCAVCLGEFDNGEWLRLLPNCSHVFHITCVDTWFQAHPNCPLCRSSVVNDLNSCHDYSSSMSLETLSREDAHREQMHRVTVTRHRQTNADWFEPESGSVVSVVSSTVVV